MQTGCEWLVDARGCDPNPLGALAAMESLCAEVVADLGLLVVGAPRWHQFDGPGGVTGMYLLSESHLTCHTYPELGIATFNLYCCRERKAWPWQARLEAHLGATHVAIRRVPRGLVQESPDTVRPACAPLSQENA